MPGCLRPFHGLCEPPNPQPQKAALGRYLQTPQISRGSLPTPHAEGKNSHKQGSVRENYLETQQTCHQPPSNEDDIFSRAG